MGLVIRFFTLSCFVLVLSSLRCAQAYQNYTVGSSLGWFDNLEKPGIDYQKWADSKSFSLGDFLIFNTDNNHSVVQTNNHTTYTLCDYDDDLTSDTIQWSTSNPSAVATESVTVSVPLLKEGTTYFFSGDYDGDQCKNGQQFKINVTHGAGLPESLKDPSDAAPGPDQSAQAGDDGSAPDTIVPANFDHPKEDTSDDDKDSDASDSKATSGDFILVPIVKFSGFLAFLVLVHIF